MCSKMELLVVLLSYVKKTKWVFWCVGPLMTAALAPNAEI